MSGLSSRIYKHYDLLTTICTPPCGGVYLATEMPNPAHQTALRPASSSSLNSSVSNKILHYDYGNHKQVFAQ